MLKLYDYFRSSASFRVRIALNLKNQPYEVIPIHLLNQGGEQFLPNYRAINPQCLVPALEDGNKVLTQSIAIIEYLDERFKTPPLLPHDIYQKALVRAFSLSIVADIHPLNNLRVLRYLKEEFHISDDKKNQWYRHWLQLGLTALESQLQSLEVSGDFSFGDTPTLADICLIPQLYNARRYECDLSPYPLLMQIDASCQKLPAFSKAWPEPLAV